MKRIYSLVAFAVSVLFFTSCDDFMDVHKEYIEGGEIIYAPKPDSVNFIAGEGRILFNCRTYNAPNVRSVDVYWNDRLDSLIIPVELSTGYDSISVILDNMEEKSYTFNIQTTDNFGHKSLFVTSFGTSYGDTYRATLNDRGIKSLSLSDKEGTIEWYSAPLHLVRNEIRYIKNDGSQTTVKIPSIDNLAKLPDVKPGSTFEYRSLYIPEEVAIDTFATAWKEYETPFPTEYKHDRSSWEGLSVSDVSTSEGDSSSITIPGSIDMKGRYLKLLLSDSNREPYTSVAEVYVYGK